MKIKQSLFAFALVGIFAGGLPTWAHATSPGIQMTDKDVVVARIDGTEIRRSDLLMAQELLPQEYKNMPLQALYPFLMKQLINNVLVVNAARSEGLDKSEDIRRRLKVLERRLVEGAYLERAAKGKVTEQALRERYDELVEPMRGTEELRVRHIMLGKKGEARDVIKALSNGADFAKLARERSLGPSKSSGGDLGFVRREALEKPLADAAFGLQTGQITTSPVETKFGWHVIKLEERRATKIPSFEQMRAKLTRQIRARLADRVVMKLRRNAQIEHFDLNGKPLLSSASRPSSKTTR